MVWKLAEAKNKLTEVVNRTLSEGPQTINRRGDEVVMISKEEYLKFRGEKPSFSKFLISGPSLEGVDLERPEEGMREVEL